MPEKLDAMIAVYERHAEGVKLDATEIRAAIGYDPEEGGDQQPYTVQDGVAVIPVEGVLAKKMNFFMSFSGGMSTQMLVQAVNDAIADPTVHSLLLAIDSPGGEVDGTQQIADAVANSTKPVCALVDGMCCSAAYWIASQCDSIYAVSDTCQIGSIGVILKHTDVSKRNAAMGVAPTHITTGKYKAAANPDNPLSVDDRAYLQGRIDHLKGLFTQAVANGRDMSQQAVTDSYGDAAVYFAQQAIANGLIDGMATQDEAINALSTAYATKLTNPGASAPAFRNNTGAPTMFRTFATEVDFNAFVSAEFARGVASVDTTAALAAARTEGASNELGRVKAVQENLGIGHDKLVNALAFDGKTSAADAAVQILAAEKAVRTTHAANLIADAPSALPATQADPNVEAANRRDAVVATAAGTDTAETDPHVIAAAAETYRSEQKAKGRTIGFAEAAAHVAAKKK